MRIPSKHSGFVNGVQTCWGGGGGQTSKTTAEIPAELKPLATKFTQSAIGLADTPYQNYADPRYADLNSYQTQGADSIYNRAMGGNSAIDAGQGMVTDTLSGDYLNSNPYLSQMMDSASQDVTRNYQNAVNSTDAGMARAGAFGGSAWGQQQKDNSDMLGKNLSNMATNMYGQNYANERSNQMNALGQGLQYGNQDYTDAAQMIKAGQMYQDQNQQGLDFNYEQFQNEQNEPYKKLAAMSGVFGTNLGQSSTTTSTGGGK